MKFISPIFLFIVLLFPHQTKNYIEKIGKLKVQKQLVFKQVNVGTLKYTYTIKDSIVNNNSFSIVQVTINNNTEEEVSGWITTKETNWKIKYNIAPLKSFNQKYVLQGQIKQMKINVDLIN